MVECLYSIRSLEYTNCCPGNTVKYPLNTKLIAQAIAKRTMPSPPNTSIAKNEQQKNEVSAQIAELESQPKPIDLSERIVAFTETIAAIQNADMPADETNALLKSCISRITYSRQRAERIKGKHGGWAENPMSLQIDMII